MTRNGEGGNPSQDADPRVATLQTSVRLHDDRLARMERLLEIQSTALEEIRSSVARLEVRGGRNQHPHGLHDNGLAGGSQQFERLHGSSSDEETSYEEFGGGMGHQIPQGFEDFEQEFNHGLRGQRGFGRAFGRNQQTTWFSTKERTWA